jgi:hypothetical protein
MCEEEHMIWITTCCQAEHQKGKRWNVCPDCEREVPMWRRQFNDARLIPPDYRNAEFKVTRVGTPGQGLTFPGQNQPSSQNKRRRR